MTIAPNSHARKEDKGGEEMEGVVWTNFAPAFGAAKSKF